MRHHFLAVLAAAGGLAATTVHASDLPNHAAPNPNFGHVLSPEEPPSIQELQSTPSPKLGAMAAAVPRETHTSLRCWYRLDGRVAFPSTSWEWGQKDGSDYQVRGYWWAPGLFNWQNMFYSSVSQRELENICKSTLRAKGLRDEIAFMAAGDYGKSFNYTIWTLDSPGATQINKVVAFGDSLSDTQNMFNASMWKLGHQDSWYLGRFSNAEVWVEGLARKLGVPLYNWATGGAAVNTTYKIPGLKDQVQSFIQYMDKAANYDPKYTQFTVWVGANDLVTYNQTVDGAIEGQKDALRQLIRRGAENIVVLNLPDISRTPRFKGDQDGASKVKANVVDFNGKLARLIVDLKSEHGQRLNLKLFDVFAVFNDVLENPSQYGIANTAESCLDINTNSATAYVQRQNLRPGCGTSHTTGYMFWDNLHPTDTIHRVLSECVGKFLKNHGAMSPQECRRTADL